MTAVLEVDKIPNPPLMRKKFRREEVYKMMEIGVLPEESGWELIDGEIIHKMTIGSKHAAVERKLGKYLERNYGDRLIISGQNPIQIDENNEPEPDIALLVPRDDFYAESHPTADDILLIIGVSDSTPEYDRDIKKVIYAEAGIAEFWLVNLQENTVETFWNPTNGNYYQMQIFQQDETIQSRNIDNLLLPVSEILGENI
jgi:Uma2 family endonuclease